MRVLKWTEVTVKTRLIIGIAAMIIPLGALAIGSLFYFHHAFLSFNRLISDPLHEINVIARIQVNLLSVSNELMNIRSMPAGDADNHIRHNSAQIEGAYRDALNIDFLLPAQGRAIIDSREEWLKALDVVRETSRLHEKEAASGDVQMAKFGTHIAHAVSFLDEASRTATGEIQELL